MTETTLPLPAPPPTWHLYRALVGVGLACGLAIVTVYEATAPIIRANRIEARNAAVLAVLPGATHSRVFRLGDDGAFHQADVDSDAPDLVFAGYDGGGGLVGLALPARGMGYQDVIELLYGYAPERQAVIGIRVLESRETPGLGDRIETDPAFLANFEALDVRVASDGESLLHPIEFVKPGEKDSPWQIDGITGATISSRAVAEMLRHSTARLIPLVARRLDDFRQRH